MKIVEIFCKMILLGYCIGVIHIAFRRYETLTHTDLVISRYQESLEPLISSPTYAWFRKIYIYNKGNPIKNHDWLPSNVEIIELPNVGCESHTYFYHMIHHRDDFGDKTLFIPGSAPHLFYKKNMLRSLVIWLPYYKYGFASQSCPNGLLEDFYDFQMERYQHSAKSNHHQNPTLAPCQDRPFGVWYEKNFGNKRMRMVTSQGMFFVTRECLLDHASEEYQRLMSYLDHERNPEAGHYMERSWAALFLKENEDMPLYALLNEQESKRFQDYLKNQMNEHKKNP